MRKMLNQELSELLSAYLDNEVDDREKTIVENALRSDPGARKLLDELRQTVSVVSSLPRHAAPPDLAPELNARLERAHLLVEFDQQKAPPQGTSSWHGYLRAAAMLGFVLVAGWWFLARQQERKSTGIALSPASPSTVIREATDSKVVPAETARSTSAPIEAEKLLSSGTDPVVLVRHSFEAEPVRIRVTARTAGERDMLARNFTQQLAQANTENLAQQKAGREQKKAIGAFYLEGKPDVNFTNPHDKQVMVRIPRSQADQLVEQVVSGSTIPADQFAFQAGTQNVKGQDNAKAILQSISQNSGSGPPTDVVADAGVMSKKSMSTGLLHTLEEIAGLQPSKDYGSLGTTNRVADTSKIDSDEVAAMKDSASSRSAAEVGSPAALTADAAMKSKSAEEAQSPEPGSLVDRKLEAAGARHAEAEPSRAPPARSKPAASSITFSSDAFGQSGFITIVVEFGLPNSAPPKKDTGRMRS